jgi:hypothetical protein
VVTTREPLRAVLRDGVDSGELMTVDVELVSYDLLLMAHGWALKHWYFERSMGFEEYVARQTALMLSALLQPRRRRSYRRYLQPDG